MTSTIPDFPAFMIGHAVLDGPCGDPPGRATVPPEVASGGFGDLGACASSPAADRSADSMHFEPHFSFGKVLSSWLSLVEDRLLGGMLRVLSGFSQFTKSRLWNMRRVGELGAYFCPHAALLIAPLGSLYTVGKEDLASGMTEFRSSMTEKGRACLDR